MRGQRVACAACSMSWAVTVVNPRPQLADLGSAVAEIGALRWVLRAVVTLAEQAPALADGALRNRLAVVAALAILVRAR